MKSLADLNDWLSSKGAGTRNWANDSLTKDSENDFAFSSYPYTDATYVEGDFTSAITAFNEMKDEYPLMYKLETQERIGNPVPAHPSGIYNYDVNYLTREQMQYFSKLLCEDKELAERLTYEVSPKLTGYNVLMSNCLQITLDGISQGLLPDGETTFEDHYSLNYSVSVRGLIPNNDALNFRSAFDNDAFTKDAARDQINKISFFSVRNWNTEKYTDMIRGLE